MARIAVCAATVPPSANRTTRAAPLVSTTLTSRALITSAPNFTACRRARSASCDPEMPSGKPR